MHFNSLKKYFRSVTGFTLTELMAVVIIIGILAALGLVSYRKSAQQATFSEALGVAAAVAESYSRYQYDTGLEPESWNQMDITLSNATPLTGLLGAKVGDKFQVRILNKTVRTTPSYVCVVPESVNSNCPVVCTADADFCKSMGYTVSSFCSGCSGYIKP